MIAIPAVLGIVINELTRGWGHEKLSPVLSPACKFMMMGVIASNSTAMSEYVLHMNAVRLEVAPLYFGLRHQWLCRRFSGRPCAASAI